MLSVIIACALAFVVSTLAVAALLIYVQNVRSSLEAQLSASFSATRDTSTTWFGQLHGRLDEFQKRVAACESGLKETSGPRVAAELADLRAAVDSLAATQRKQFGKVWAELHHDGVLKRNTESQGDETPEQVRERLRQQHALPRIGAVNGAAGDE